MRSRPLTQKEKNCILQVIAPYGLRNYQLVGGSMEIRDDEDIVYHLSIEHFNPLGSSAKRFAFKIKDALGADKVYIEGIEF